MEDCDVFLVNGGDAVFLAYWMRESGLADLLPSLDDKVWVGLSGGSMAMTPKIGSDFVGWSGKDTGDAALGFVDFAIFPHVGAEGCPWNTFENADKWAVEIGTLAYATDVHTAFKVVDGVTEIISEGTWRAYNQ